jgi:hypothetical protein
MVLLIHPQAIAVLLIRQCVYVNSYQAIRLSNVLILQPDGDTSLALPQITRSLSFTGLTTTEKHRESVFTVFQRAAALQLLHVHSVSVDSFFLGLVSSRHSHSLQDLHVRLTHHHETTTYLLERLPRLRKLSLVYDLTGNSPIKFSGRPLGRTTDTFGELVFFSFELKPTCTAAQHDQGMRFVSQFRFVAVTHVGFTVHIDDGVETTTENMLHFIGAHRKTLKSLRLDVSSPVLEVVLGDASLPNVYIQSYDGVVAVGALISSHVSFLSIAWYDEHTVDATFFFSTACLLYTILGRVVLGRFVDDQLAIAIIKMADFTWSSSLSEGPDSYGIVVGYLAHALLAYGVQLVDGTDHDIEGRFVPVDLTAVERPSVSNV